MRPRPSAVQALIRENKTYQLVSMLETGAKDGMITLDRSLENLCAAGFISPAVRATFMLTGSVRQGNSAADPRGGAAVGGGAGRSR